MNDTQALEMRFYSLCRAIYLTDRKNRTARAVERKRRLCLKCGKEFVSMEGYRVCPKCHVRNSKLSERAGCVVVFENSQHKMKNHEKYN